MIIGLSGRAGVGKTTLAKIAEEKYNFTRVSFATLLKQELIEYLTSSGWEFNPDKFYGTPQDKASYVVMPSTHDIPESYCRFDAIWNVHMISYRSLMHWFGDVKRAENKDYLLQQFMNSVDFSKDIIVDDVRFTNEAALIQALGGIIVRISWPARQKPSKHISETQMDNFPAFDSVITKADNISIDEFHAICEDHLALWLGDLDEPTSNDNLCHATSTFNINTLRMTYARNK